MTEPDRKIWHGVLAHLRSHHPAVCRQWFEDLEPMGFAGGALVIRAHSATHRDYLRRQCLDAFNDAAQAVTGQLVGVRFLGAEDDPPRELAPPPAGAGRDAREPAPDGALPPAPERRPVYHASESHAPGPRDGLPINPDYGFENFVRGPNNDLALAASQAVSEKPGYAYNPLFIHGGVGLGKTHLLQAICLTIKAANPRALIYYTSCEGFVTQFMDAVRGGEMADFRHRFRDVDVLVIDDIHFLTKREQTQEEFFHTFNSLYQARKQIVLSSDARPDEIPALEDRLVSRFNWGLVAEVDRPEYETRVEIVKTKARLRGLALPDNVACHIASEIDSNIRELEGAITRLQIEAAVRGTPINLELARLAIGDRTRPVTGGPSIETIITVVSDFYQVKRTDVLGKRRHKSISLPRQVCMFLARSHTRHSLEEIGAHFGGRDHTTVMHAVRAIKDRASQDTEFRSLVSSLEKRIQSRD